jgi:hypothetical protein
LLFYIVLINFYYRLPLWETVDNAFILKIFSNDNLIKFIVSPICSFFGDRLLDFQWILWLWFCVVTLDGVRPVFYNINKPIRTGCWYYWVRIHANLSSIALTFRSNLQFPLYSREFGIFHFIFVMDITGFTSGPLCRDKDYILLTISNR